MTKGQKGHSVYILSCSDGSFYTGITNDLSRRLSEQGSLLPGSCRQPEAADPAFKATCFLHWLVRGTRLLMGTHNRAVLFATKSFWEGVPGEALSLVIIDRLPFAPNRDPVIQHWRQRIREAGGQPVHAILVAGGDPGPEAGRGEADPHRDRPRCYGGPRFASQHQTVRPPGDCQPASGAKDTLVRGCGGVLWGRGMKPLIEPF